MVFYYGFLVLRFGRFGVVVMAWVSMEGESMEGESLKVYES